MTEVKKLSITVFVTGMCCLILEMVGCRMLAPYVGTSITVWTSVIATVLAACALGNLYGGKISDRKKSSVTLGSILFFTCLACAFSFLCYILIFNFIAYLIPNIYCTAIILAICLLALPSFCMGMVTPYAVKLALEINKNAPEISGTIVGRLYAYTTIGSIIGTILGGFVLISCFRTITIFVFVAFTFLLLTEFYERKNVFFYIVLVTLFGESFFYYTDRHIESPYNMIEVVDHVYKKEPVRYLFTGNRSYQSGMYINKPNELLFDYTKYYLLGLHFYPSAHDILVIGGGGYSVPKKFLELQKNVTVVEIDSKLLEVAEKFFALKKSPSLTVIHEDGRLFLNKTEKKYDIVCVDVFTESIIPFHLITKEACQKLAKITKSVAIINVIASVKGDKSHLLWSLVATLKECFRDIQVYPVFDKASNALQNVMILASPKQKLPEYPPESKEIAGLLEKKYTDPFPWGLILTDEFAPVELYTAGYAVKR